MAITRLSSSLCQNRPLLLDAIASIAVHPGPCFDGNTRWVFVEVILWSRICLISYCLTRDLPKRSSPQSWNSALQPPSIAIRSLYLQSHDEVKTSSYLRTVAILPSSPRPFHWSLIWCRADLIHELLYRLSWIHSLGTFFIDLKGRVKLPRISYTRTLVQCTDLAGDSSVDP